MKTNTEIKASFLILMFTLTAMLSSNTYADQIKYDIDSLVLQIRAFSELITRDKERIVAEKNRILQNIKQIKRELERSILDQTRSPQTHPSIFQFNNMVKQALATHAIHVINWWPDEIISLLDDWEPFFVSKINIVGRNVGYATNLIALQKTISDIHVTGRNAGFSTDYMTLRSSDSEFKVIGRNAGYSTDLTITQISEHEIDIQGRNAGFSTKLTLKLLSEGKIHVVGRNVGYSTDLKILKLSDSEYRTTGRNAGYGTDMKIKFNLFNADFFDPNMVFMFIN